MVTQEVVKQSQRGRHGRGKGFAAMSPEKKREIASMGGRAAHRLGRAHKWTLGDPDASRAGKIGGAVSRRGPNKLSSEQRLSLLAELAGRGVI